MPLINLLLNWLMRAEGTLRGIGWRNWMLRNQQRQIDAQYDFSGSGSTDGRAALHTGQCTRLRKHLRAGDNREDHRAVNVAPLSSTAVGNQSSPLPDSLLRKEVAHANEHLTQRATDSESGAQNLHPCKVFPAGRWTARN